MADKTRQEHLREVSTELLLKEIERRRKAALEQCSDEEISAELEKRPYDGPKYVEK